MSTSPQAALEYLRVAEDVAEAQGVSLHELACALKVCTKQTRPGQSWQALVWKSSDGETQQNEFVRRYA